MTVCKHYQNGFCKYRQQCEKKHVSEMCPKEITMKKHFNSKHKNTVNCQKCDKVFEIQGLLDNHINEHHNIKSSPRKNADDNKITPEVSETDDHECSLCEDKFSTQKEYDKHVNDHIQDINQIDIETLKGGHETFKCNLCDFQSGDTPTVKDHLKDHINTTLSTTIADVDKTSQKEKKIYAKKEAIKSGNLLDLYDDDGNPLYDTTDDESTDSE